MSLEFYEYAKYFSRDKKTRIWIIASVASVLLFMLIFIFGVYLSIYTGVLEKNVALGRKLLISQEIKKDLLENYDIYAERANKIYNGMSKKWSQPELVREIENLARENKVNIKGQNYRSLDSENLFDSYQIDINAVGHYPKIKQFVSGLESLRGKSVIEYLKLTNENDKEGIYLSIRLKVYHLKG